MILNCECTTPNYTPGAYNCWKSNQIHTLAYLSVLQVKYLTEFSQTLNANLAEHEKKHKKLLQWDVAWTGHLCPTAQALGLGRAAPDVPAPKGHTDKAAATRSHQHPREAEVRHTPPDTDEKRYLRQHSWRGRGEKQRQK